MDKPRMRHIGMKIDDDLFQKVKDLAYRTGVTANFACRCALVEMVTSGTIPLPGTMRTSLNVEQPSIRDTRVIELESELQRLQKKLEEVKTFAYDGESPKGKPVSSGSRKVHASRAQ